MFHPFYSPSHLANYNPRMRAIYHEAGHATIGHLTGMPIRGVNVEAPSSGLVILGDNRVDFGYLLPSFNYLADLASSDFEPRYQQQIKRDAIRNIIQLLAGHQSELMYSGISNKDGASADNQTATNYLTQFYQSRATNAFGHYGGLTNWIIRSNWTYVDHVATYLASKPEVWTSGRELYSVFNSIGCIRAGFDGCCTAVTQNGTHCVADATNYVSGKGMLCDVHIKPLLSRLKALLCHHSIQH